MRLVRLAPRAGQPAARAAHHGRHRHGVDLVGHRRPLERMAHRRTRRDRLVVARPRAGQGSRFGGDRLPPATVHTVALGDVRRPRARHRPRSACSTPRACGSASVHGPRCGPHALFSFTLLPLFIWHLVSRPVRPRAAQRRAEIGALSCVPAWSWARRPRSTAPRSRSAPRSACPAVAGAVRPGRTRSPPMTQHACRP